MKEKTINYWQYAFILLVLFPLAAAFSWRIYAPSDDAYIFMIYAKNFLEGNGLTYNGIVVQGFSSTLWVVLLTLLGYTGISLPVLAESMSLFSGLFAMLTTYLLGKSVLGDDKWQALLPVVLLAGTGDFVFYMSNGLEEVLFTALIALCAYFMVAKESQVLLKSNYFPAWLALMALARPEGALIAGLMLFVLAVERRSLKASILCGLKLTVMLAPVFIATRLYYGYWLPNTWYVKGNAGLANLGHGLAYFYHAFWRYSGLIVVLSAAGIAAYRKLGLTVFAKNWGLIFIGLVWVAYICIQGGDNMVGGRVLIPVLPLAYVVLVKLLSDAQVKPWALNAIVLGLAVFLAVGYLADQNVTNRRDLWTRKFEYDKAAAVYLAENFPDSTVVAVSAAGVIPYYSEMTTIDMLGLNDVHIAHEGQRDYTLRYGHQAGDGEYVLSLDPDVIFLGGWDEPGNHLGDKVIYESAEFQNAYRLLEREGMRSMYIRVESPAP